MSFTGTLRSTLLVARLTVHRSWRRAIRRPRILLLQIGLVVAAWTYIVLIGTQAPGLGGPTGTTSEVDPAELREATRGMVAALWLFHVGIAAKGTPTHATSVPGGDFLLRSAGIRPTLWGTMLGEYARRLVLFGMFAVVTAVALLWGVSLPTRSPLVMLAVLVLFLTAEMAGMAVRLTAAATGIRPGAVGRVALGGVGLVVVSLAIGYPDVTRSVLSETPVANFAEAFLMNVPVVTADRTAVTGIVVASLVALPVLALAIEGLARRTWFRGDQRTAAGVDRTRLDAWLGAMGVDGATRAVTWRLWLQSRRKPIVLGLLGVPFLVVGLAVVGPESSQFPLFPLSVGLYAVWMTGFVLTLNPLSAENGTLAHLLTVDGDEIVGGYVLTAAAVGLPVTIATTLAGGLLTGPASLIPAALVVCIAVFLGTIPASIALGLVLPRFDAVPVETDGPIAPSKFAMVSHTLVIGLLAAPGFTTLHFADEWGTTLLVPVGIVLTVGLSFAVGVLTYRSAAQRLDRLTVE